MANEEMIQKHLDNFLAKIAGETPVDDEPRDSTEFWLKQIAEQGGGTNVIANPTMAGTEDDLTGIEIDGTKYKIPKGSYIAAMRDSTHITTESFNFMYANYATIPCFVFYNSILYRITSIVTGGLRSDAVETSTSISSFNLSHIFIASDGSFAEGVQAIAAVNVNQGTSVTTPNLTSLTLNGNRYKVCDGVTNGLGYLSIAPTAANTNGLKIVVLSSEPATKYDGWLYIILA